VVLYYDSGKIEVRDKNLKYISSWYQWFIQNQKLYFNFTIWKPSKNF
jgi:hypothetical protein